jgi:hypothetical protein
LKQEEEFQENRKLGNLIRKVNEDEYEYMIELERELREKERVRILQEQEELQKFREQVKQFEEREQKEKEDLGSIEVVDNRKSSKPTMTPTPSRSTKDLRKAPLLSNSIKIKTKPIRKSESNVTPTTTETIIHVPIVSGQTHRPSSSYTTSSSFADNKVSYPTSGGSLVGYGESDEEVSC